MKKSLSLLVILLCSITISFAQPTIKKLVESVDSKHYQIASRELSCFNEKQTKGFTLIPIIECKYNQCNVKTLTIVTYNLGLFTENSELLFTFEDKTQLSICSQNSFNCKGLAVFILCPYAIEKLSTVKVTKIKFKNGYNKKKISKKLKNENEFFIDLFNSIIKPH